MTRPATQPVTQASRYLLDTNIISDLVKWPRGEIAQAITRVGEDAVFTSIIVASELRYGVSKKGSNKLALQVETILAEMEIAPFEQPADQIYAEVRHHLTQSGTPIGPNDLLIAAHALALDAILVTANEAEFARVPGLAVQNWLNY
ncbi:type II toxin-antitoxin system VapC family toxin [Halothiobacillus sp.]|uniref:type II toxin-antitoxin system VapC family toxin n=1 Tax=Halothiobacillus sp. TaxID=1891311 RepID=UPI000BC42FBF|nr:type II toxin-antitoxin system VapC family toxin [Halothiobacillus sp.]OZB55834.1 MAG: VapC toxin family PIN domain ribonuclease [Halothiobacillus sp. 14-56-357]OZB77077.1 MAG: VapC toxin family PIN domain ribonuclease [Halothiobacillus sp. 13-55-115]